MKFLKGLLLVSFCAVISLNATAGDKEEIKQLINEAYVDAIHNFGDLEKARNGFVSEFVMFIQGDEQIGVIKLEDWLQRIETGRKNNPVPPETTAKAEYLSIYTEGSSAIVILELHRGGQKLFTDYFNLYKLDGEWKIVAKTFYRH